jgi:hypothetical protein
MAIPEKYLRMMGLFERALRTEDFSEINTIPLNELQLAKAYLHLDRNMPFYQLILDKIREKERQKELEENIRRITFNISQSPIGILNTGEIREVESIAANVSLLDQEENDKVGIAILNLTKAVTDSKELSETQRKEALEFLETLSGQAPIPQEKRLPSASLKAVFNGLASTINTAGSLAQLWTTWGTQIAAYFGF